MDKKHRDARKARLREVFKNASSGDLDLAYARAKNQFEELTLRAELNADEMNVIEVERASRKR